MTEKGHTVRCQGARSRARPEPPPVCPPRTADGVRRRLKPRAPYHPRRAAGIVGTRPRRPRPGSGHNDPRNPGEGSPRQIVTRNGQPGTTPPRTLPGDGGVGESRPGRWDPGAPRPGPPRDEPRSGDGRDRWGGMVGRTRRESPGGRKERNGGETQRKIQAATSRRRSATSTAGKGRNKRITRGEWGRNRSRTRNRNHRRGPKSQSSTAVERKKKMVKEVESGGVDTRRRKVNENIVFTRPSARLVDLTY